IWFPNLYFNFPPFILPGHGGTPGFLHKPISLFMPTNLIIIVASVFATIVLSLIFGNLLSKRRSSKRLEETEEKSRLILKEAEIAAENLKKDKILEAKEKILKMRTEFEEEANRKKS